MRLLYKSSSMSIDQANKHNAYIFAKHGREYPFSVISMHIANELVKLGRPDLLELCFISTPVPSTPFLRDIL